MEVTKPEVALPRNHLYSGVARGGGGKGGGRPGRRVERGAKIVGKKNFL